VSALNLAGARIRRGTYRIPKKQFLGIHVLNGREDTVTFNRICVRKHRSAVFGSTSHSLILNFLGHSRDVLQLSLHLIMFLRGPLLE